jgi:hypothetical protein
MASARNALQVSLGRSVPLEVASFLYRGQHGDFEWSATIRPVLRDTRTLTRYLLRLKSRPVCHVAMRQLFHLGCTRSRALFNAGKGCIASTKAQAAVATLAARFSSALASASALAHLENPHRHMLDCDQKTCMARMHHEAEGRISGLDTIVMRARSTLTPDTNFQSTACCWSLALGKHSSRKRCFPI